MTVQAEIPTWVLLVFCALSWLPWVLRLRLWLYRRSLVRRPDSVGGLDVARGESLDRIGEGLYDLPRMVETDTAYRARLRERALVRP